MAKSSSKWGKSILAYSLKNAVEHEGKCQEGSVISGLFAEGLKREEVKSIIQEVKKTVSEVNKLGLEEQQKQFKSSEKLVGHRTEREGLPELPNVKGKIRMRFAPAPSGQLHLGHVISNVASSLYVKKYGGEFYLRIEDTNPEKIDLMSYKGLVEDSSWLFGNISEVIIQSDRVPVYYKYAEELIKKGAAYVCDCDNEKFKELILKNKSCPCRKNSVQENLIRWTKMLDKKGYKEGEAVLRFKSDLDNPNPALRDFPLARINLTKHPRVGLKYRVWPLMNLSVTCDDLEYNMTHIIRGKDHKDNAERQKMIYKVLGLENKFPVTIFMGRMKFSDMDMSKRKITAAIKEGDFEGWDDVRLPTVAALRKRGYLRETFEKLAIQRGISEVDKVITKKDFFEILDNFNREILHEIAKKAGFSEDKKGKFTIVMPDNKKLKFNSEIKPKASQIYYFPGFGYSRYEGKEKLFYFTHK